MKALCLFCFVSADSPNGNRQEKLYISIQSSSIFYELFRASQAIDCWHSIDRSRRCNHHLERRYIDPRFAGGLHCSICQEYFFFQIILSTQCYHLLTFHKARGGPRADSMFTLPRFYRPHDKQFNPLHIATRGLRRRENQKARRERHEEGPRQLSPRHGEAICEPEKGLLKRFETRPTNPLSNMAEAGEHLLSVFESELENAQAWLPSWEAFSKRQYNMASEAGTVYPGPAEHFGVSSEDLRKQRPQW